MPPRTSPTERQKRLGYEVRKIRTSAGMSTETAAALLGLDRAKISNIETGIRTLSVDRLRTLACNCHCSDGDYVEALVALSQSDRSSWWEKYRGSLSPGLLDIAELEARARRIRCIHLNHIPGFLQTGEHILATFRFSVPKLSEEESSLRLAFRAQRQKLLEGRDAPEYVAVIHESALRMRFGGPDVVRRQLEHILKQSTRPHIRVVVLPFESEGFVGSGQIAHYLEGPVPQLDTVEIDSSHGPEFLHTEAQLARYREQLDLSERMALSASASQDFIQNLIDSL